VELATDEMSIFGCMVIEVMLSVIAAQSYKNALQNLLQGKGMALPEYNPITQPGND